VEEAVELSSDYSMNEVKHSRLLSKKCRVMYAFTPLMRMGKWKYSSAYS